MKMLMRQAIFATLGLSVLLGGCYEERKFLELGIPAQGNETFAEFNPVDDMHDLGVEGSRGRDAHARTSDGAKKHAPVPRGPQREQ
jgi:hypothetical protein